MNDRVPQISDSTDVDSTVLAAMAHLHLAMIQPFKNRNGSRWRMPCKRWRWRGTQRAGGLTSNAGDRSMTAALSRP